MKNLPVPVGNHFDEFKKLVARKDDGPVKIVLEKNCSKIELRFAKYEQNRQTPENIDFVKRTKKLKNALKSCYDNSEKFKSDILEAMAIDDTKPTPRCPYCQIDPARTWDHFLPASKFPDFYVYPPNLIRACNNCNETKNTNRVTPVRKTINPFFDPLDNVRYLKCTIQRTGELIPTFSIDPDTTVPTYSGYVDGIVRHHFESYDLSRKFRAEASSKISSFKKDIKYAYRLTGQLPTQRTIDDLIELERHDLIQRGDGANSWEIVFWDGMHDFQGLLAYSEDVVLGRI